MKEQPRTSEHEIQSQLMEWAAYHQGCYPELKWFHAIPNGARLPYARDRNNRRYSPAAQRLKKEGLRSGIPDTCLPVARGSFHGLYLELKALDGDPKDTQIECVRFLNTQGYFACFCYGLEAAVTVLEWYVSLPPYGERATPVSMPPEAVIPLLDAQA